MDLDIVNPYFRTADFGRLFAEHGVTMITPDYANSNVDIPVLNFDLERIASDPGYLIVDVGGDDAGATALGRYAEAFSQYADCLDMLYVINCYRYLTKTPQEALTMMYEIEQASHMKHTGIVNNSNLAVKPPLPISSPPCPLPRNWHGRRIFHFCTRPMTIDYRHQVWGCIRFMCMSVPSGTNGCHPLQPITFFFRKGESDHG